MGVSSFFGKNKQEPVPGGGDYQVRSEEDSGVARARRKRKQSATDEPIDPVLPEKKRARRRLVGAIALVLGAVIGLPMILESEPKPLGDDIAIQIPSKDKPFSGSPNDESGFANKSTSTHGAKVPAAASLDKNEEILAQTGGAADAKAGAASGSLSAPAEAGKNNQTQPPAQAGGKAGSETQAGVKPDDAARARALLEEKQDAGKQEERAEKAKASLEKKTARYMVQVAALASQEKANELQGRLKNAGIKSQTQKISTLDGERIRIRIGPFASKDEAEKARAKLVKMGLSGTLVPA